MLRATWAPSCRARSPSIRPRSGFREVGPRVSRRAIVLLVIALLLIVPSGAAAATVRSEFFGIVQASTLDNIDLQRLKNVRVRTDRYLFPWYSVQPTRTTFH